MASLTKVPLEPMVTVFCTLLVATVKGSSTWTTNVLVPPANGVTAPTVSVHVVPAGSPSAQLQPPELPVMTKCALIGTVSVSTTDGHAPLIVLV